MRRAPPTTAALQIAGVFDWLQEAGLRLANRDAGEPPALIWLRTSARAVSLR